MSSLALPSSQYKQGAYPCITMAYHRYTAFPVMCLAAPGAGTLGCVSLVNGAYFTTGNWKCQGGFCIFIRYLWEFGEYICNTYRTGGRLRAN